MTDEKTTFDKNSILFSQLVLSFQASAMQQMGKIKNPFTDKIERNMSQAQITIDMVTMLQEKTRGNLSDEESRYLEHVLYELRMNYVDEVKKEQAKDEKKEVTDEDIEGEKETGEEKPQEFRHDEDKTEEKATGRKERGEGDRAKVNKVKKKERKKPSAKAEKKKTGSKEKKH